MKFPQKITFVATLTTNTEGMDWEKAVEVVNQGLLEGDLNPERSGLDPYTLDLVKVTRMEIVEGDS